jgi:hypothetical protein
MLSSNSSVAVKQIVVAVTVVYRSDLPPMSLNVDFGRAAKPVELSYSSSFCMLQPDWLLYLFISCNDDVYASA